MASPGYIPTSKNFSELLSRWGGKQFSFGGLFSKVVPTVVVDRFRGPDEANIWVCETETAGASGEFSACGIVNLDETVDWELLALTYTNTNPIHTIITHDPAFQICTPLATAADPTQNNTISGFVPGLITDLSTTFGPLRGFSGTSPSLVTPFGEIHRPTRTHDQFFRFNGESHVEFDPPLRFYGTRAVVCQNLVLLNPASAHPITVCWRYRVRPKRLQQ